MEEQYVVFKLGQEEYGLDILMVQEIVRPLETTKLPNSPDYILGIVNLREDVIPIIDLRRFFNLEVTDVTDDSRVIVIKQNDHAFGVFVDEVHEVLRINKGQIKSNEALDHNINKKYIKGVAKVQQRLIILLDLTTAV
ncbi:MAG: chemotaxis protein CheW [Peptococcia bacterium]